MYSVNKTEAEYVIHQIEQMIGGLSYFSIDSERVSGDDDHSDRTFADFAVLYRLGAQSQPLIEAFHRSGIPYQTVGQAPLAAYKEIKTVLACLWLMQQPNSTFHLEQVAPEKQLPNVEAFLDELRNKVTTQPVSISIEQIYQFLADHTGFRVDEKSDDRIQQLMLRAAPFENRLEAFLEEIMLQKETDIYDPRADRVTLMTLHASKGLEFRVVFIVGCEDNLLPYQREGKYFDLDEERRLFYVGMTRAQQKLILTHAKSRFLFGQRYEPKPSRFIDDIENALKERKKMASRKPAAREQDNLQLKLF